MKRHAKLFTSHGLSRQTAFRLSLSGMRHAACGKRPERRPKRELASYTKHRKPRDGQRDGRRCSEALINIFNFILFNYTDVYSFRRCVASLPALNCELTHTLFRPFFINYKLRADYTHYKRFSFRAMSANPIAGSLCLSLSLDSAPWESPGPGVAQRPFNWLAARWLACAQCMPSWYYLWARCVFTAS